MTNSLSTLSEVIPKQEVCQWVKCTPTGAALGEPITTQTYGAPYLMPGVIIFVHGVNSEGEWYKDAAQNFAAGLNVRLGRDDLESLGIAGTEKRFGPIIKDKPRKISTVIPFYWGYSANKKECLKDCTKNVPGTTNVWTDVHGNPLRQDRSWGGGPFANGTTTLQEFWGNGFIAKYLNGFINLNTFNPMLGRELLNCPERLYYVHAARRLANLVKTIRKDFPDEPINIVSHSQGTMITLCSLFYMDKVRGPDTILLNSSPFRIDTRIHDATGVAAGIKVEGEESRLTTLYNAADLMAQSLKQFKPDPHPPADFGHQHNARHAYDDAVYVRHDPGAKDWEAMIGGSAGVNDGGIPWWKRPLHAGENRGKIFINFNPGDRVIGTSVIAGIGWRGIGVNYLNENESRVGRNVYQRLFSRSTNAQNPAPGSKTNYLVSYYFSQLERPPGRFGEGNPDVDLVGSPTQWRYFNSNSESGEYRFPSELILHALPVLGTMRPTANEPFSDGVYINAPLVPDPPKLPHDFDGDMIRFDGEENENQKTKADVEAIKDFEDFALYSPHKQIEFTDARGLLVKRDETHKEVQERLRDHVGGELVSPTNHASILRYKSELGTCPVSDVLTYDLAVGPGYAWGDPDYWKYLWDLADWKRSDPYYQTGVLHDSEKYFPDGIGTRMVAAKGERYADYPGISNFPAYTVSAYG